MNHFRLSTRRRTSFRAIGIVLSIFIACASPIAGYLNPLASLPAHANGFIDFEDGVDSQPIRSTIPGLEFITTDSQDWIYGDWRTGNYNGKYPNGSYTSNGNFFAWLGPNQGDGRINFTLGGATYLSVGVSTADSVTLRGYAEDGTLLDVATFSGGNLGTGFTNQIQIQTSAARKFAYAIVSGNANYWLIDDLATDAAGVPNTKTPLIFIPGIMGTSLDNRNGEVWPNGWELITDPDDDSLLVLRLASDGESPLQADNADYNSVTVDGVLLRAAGEDVYDSAFNFLGTRGYKIDDQTLFVLPYDWRKDNQIAADQLDALIAQIKETTGAEKVNILAHSMGGLVARLYIGDPARAANVDTLVTLGTPYLGAPKGFRILHYGSECMFPILWKCWLNRTTMQTMVQNMPGVYQLLPGPNYFKVYPNGHLNMDRDTNGDGVKEGWLDFAAVSGIVNQNHTATVFAKALPVFDKVESYAGGTNSVKVYVFAGMQQGTPGTVREYMKRTWTGGEKLEYDFVTVGGDGTVPLHSADLGRNDPDHDFSGSVSYYYVRGEHGELARFENAGAAVLALAADILEDDAANLATASHRPAAAGNMLYQPDAPVAAAPAATSTAAPNAVPITLEPEPLAGYQVLVYGNSLLEVTDTQGNVTQVSADNILENSIPGSSVDRLGDTISIFVPADAVYQVQASAQGEDEVDMRIRVIEDDAVTESVIYKDIPVQPGTVAAMEYDPAAAAPALAIDADGDGSVDTLHDPDAVLGGAAVNDTTAPTSQIAVTYSTTATLATVSLAGSDEAGGSGILRLEYSLDNGATSQVYTEPFSVDWRVHPQLLVKAIDQAGNEEYPLAHATLSNGLYLPQIQN